MPPPTPSPPLLLPSTSVLVIVVFGLATKMAPPSPAAPIAPEQAVDDVQGALLVLVGESAAGGAGHIVDCRAKRPQHFQFGSGLDCASLAHPVGTAANA